MKLSAIKIDAKRLEQGAWVDGIPGMGDLRLKVRGVANKDAQRLRAKLTEALPRARRLSGAPDPDAAEEIATQVLAETVLCDWANLTDEAGAPVPFSVARAHEILADPDMIEFRAAVYWAAGTLAEAGAASLETDAKNSGAPSNGGTSSAMPSISSTT